MLLGFTDGSQVGPAAADACMALARAELSQLRQRDDSPWAGYVLVHQDEDPRVHAAQLRGVQARLCKRWGLEDAQLALFASEGEATVVSLQAMMLRCPTRDVVLSSPTRPALVSTLALCDIEPHDVSRGTDGLPLLAEWRAAVARHPGAIFVVSWEPEACAELEVALQAGVRPEQLMVLAGLGFVGQLPWSLAIRPATAIAALRDPDRPGTPLAWVVAEPSGRMSRLGFGAASVIALPALAALESTLHTLETWPTWTANAVALLEARATALRALVHNQPLLALWPRHGGEALIHCKERGAEALANLWCQNGWSCRAAKHPVYGDFVVVDLYASQPLLGASKEWPEQP